MEITRASVATNLLPRIQKLNYVQKIQLKCPKGFHDLVLPLIYKTHQNFFRSVDLIRFLKLLPSASLFVILGVVVLPSVAAQAADDPSRPIVTKEIDDLITIIEDDGEREKFLQRLRLLKKASEDSTIANTPTTPGATVLQQLSDQVSVAGSRLVQSVETLTTLPGAVVKLFKGLNSTEERGIWLGAIFKILAVLLAGYLTEILIRRLVKRPREAIESTDRETFWSRLPLQIGRFLLELIGIVAAVTVAYALLSATDPGNTTRVIAIALINATALVRLISALMRVALSPRVNKIRLVPVSDETANYWSVWIRRLSVFSVYGYIALETGYLLGFQPELYNVLSSILGLGVLLMLIVLVQQNRRLVAKLISGHNHDSAASLFRKRIGELWNVATIVYLVLVFAVWISDKPGSFLVVVKGSLATIIIIVGAIILGTIVNRLVDRSFRLSDELRTRFPYLEARTNRFVPKIKTIITTLVSLIAVLSILNSWGINVTKWFESELGALITEKVGSIVFIIFIAVAIWEIVSSLIEHTIHRSQSSTERSARLETLLPLARKTLLVVLSVMVTLTVLSELGLNIGPLLAGAGVVGLAIGFGAQSLVKDIITGIFILIEDSISVGDFVDVGGPNGTVESLSIRTLRLRDIEGNVSTIPFSSVNTVLNYTRDYGISLLEIGIAYREDVDQVIEVLKRLGEEMMEDEGLAKDILEPLVVQGIHRLDDSAVTLRARIKTTAGMQWAMRREFFKRMKKRFDELEIEIPFPHQTIYFGADKKGFAQAAPIQIENKPERVKED